MKTIALPLSFSNKTTRLYKIDGDVIVWNGCQVFDIEDIMEVKEEFDVPDRYIDDVIRVSSFLTEDMTYLDVINVLANDTDKNWANEFMEFYIKKTNLSPEKIGKMLSLYMREHTCSFREMKYIYDLMGVDADKPFVDYILSSKMDLGNIVSYFYGLSIELTRGQARKFIREKVSYSNSGLYEFQLEYIIDVINSFDVIIDNREHGDTILYFDIMRLAKDIRNRLNDNWQRAIKKFEEDQR